MTRTLFANAFDLRLPQYGRGINAGHIREVEPGELEGDKLDAALARGDAFWIEDHLLGRVRCEATAYRAAEFDDRADSRAVIMAFAKAHNADWLASSGRMGLFGLRFAKDAHRQEIYDDAGELAESVGVALFIETADPTPRWLSEPLESYEDRAAAKLKRYEQAYIRAIAEAGERGEFD